jgi:hypothetical protein
VSEKPKIKITDNPELRIELEKLVGEASHVNLANWAMRCAQHILHLSNDEPVDLILINNGFDLLDLWQKNKATVYEVRKAALKIHEEARKCKTEVNRTILRTAGHAVSVGHMREHALVCSDYAIKAIQLVAVNNSEKITEERQWQIQELKKANH